MTSKFKPKSVACVILASGYGHRFGADKLAHVLPSSKSLLQQTIGSYALTFDQINVVLRPEQAHLYNQLSHCNYILNDAAELGLSQSIVTAVRQVSDGCGWLFALGDMPYVSQSTIELIVGAAMENNIVQPWCEQRPGNPVFIGRAFSEQLKGLRGDIGAKKLISSVAKSQLIKLQVSDSGIHHDIDRLDDIRG